VSRSDDRQRIGRAFHRQAGEYDQHAVVQKRVVADLVQLIKRHVTAAPVRLLDVGCGTGALLSALQDCFPAAGLAGLDLAFNMARHSAARFGDQALIVNGDAEMLPYRRRSFDLVVSASTLQWLPRLDCCLAECCRVLMDGGLLCLAFFGGSTLWELQESYRQALSSHFGNSDSRIDRLHRFKQLSEVEQALTLLDFDQVMVTSEIVMEHHADVAALLRSIKGVGAGTASRSDTAGGLGWRAVLSDMADYYRSHFEKDGMIPASYEVIYVVARRGHSTGK